MLAEGNNSRGYLNCSPQKDSKAIAVQISKHEMSRNVSEIPNAESQELGIERCKLGRRNFVHSDLLCGDGSFVLGSRERKEPHLGAKYFSQDIDRFHGVLVFLV